LKWMYLGLSILFEVFGTTILKLSAVNENNTRLLAGVAIIFYFACFYFLRFALKYFELGSVYAIWSGMGIALLTVVGIIVFSDSISITKLVFIGLILIGTVGLNLTGLH